MDCVHRFPYVKYLAILLTVLMSDSQLANASGDIAYDWINKKIYVVDSTRGKILLGNTDGSDVVTVLNVIYPLAIALHPCQGLAHFRSCAIC